MSTMICRLCLNDAKLIDIFDPRLTNSEQLRKCVLLSTGVEICLEDAVTKYVCQACSDIAIFLYKYRINALANDKALKEFANQSFVEASSRTKDIAKVNSIIVDSLTKDYLNSSYVPKTPEKIRKPVQTNFAVDPTIVQLIKHHPKLKIPNEILKYNIQPKVVLDEAEVDNWVPPAKLEPPPSPKPVSDLELFKMKFPGINIMKISHSTTEDADNHKIIENLKKRKLSESPCPGRISESPSTLLKKKKFSEKPVSPEIESMKGFETKLNESDTSRLNDFQMRIRLFESKLKNCEPKIQVYENKLKEPEAVKTIVPESKPQTVVTESKVKPVISESTAKTIESESKTKSVVSESNTKAILLESKTKTIISESKTKAKTSESKTKAIISETKTKTAISEPRTKPAISDHKAKASMSEPKVKAPVSESKVKEPESKTKEPEIKKKSPSVSKVIASIMKETDASIKSFDNALTELDSKSKKKKRGHPNNSEREQIPKLKIKVPKPSSKETDSEKSLRKSISSSSSSKERHVVKPAASKSISSSSSSKEPTSSKSISSSSSSKERHVVEPAPSNMISLIGDDTSQVTEFIEVPPPTRLNIAPQPLHQLDLMPVRTDESDSEKITPKKLHTKKLFDTDSEQSDNESIGANDWMMDSLLDTVEEEVSFTCNLCNKLFGSEYQLKCHERCHRNCTICKAVFRSADALKIHHNEVCFKSLVANPPFVVVPRVDEIATMLHMYPNAFSPEEEEVDATADFGPDTLQQHSDNAEEPPDVFCISDDDDDDDVMVVQDNIEETLDYSITNNTEFKYVCTVFSKYKDVKFPTTTKSRYTEMKPQINVRYNQKNQIVLESMYPELKAFRVPVELISKPNCFAYVSFNRKIMDDNEIYSWSNEPVVMLSEKKNALLYKTVENASNSSNTNAETTSSGSKDGIENTTQGATIAIPDSVAPQLIQSAPASEPVVSGILTNIAPQPVDVPSNVFRTGNTPQPVEAPSNVFQTGNTPQPVDVPSNVFQTSTTTQPVDVPSNVFRRVSTAQPVDVPSNVFRTSSNSVLLKQMLNSTESNNPPPSTSAVNAFSNIISTTNQVDASILKSHLISNTNNNFPKTYDLTDDVIDLIDDAIPSTSGVLHSVAPVPKDNGFSLRVKTPWELNSL